MSEAYRLFIANHQCKPGFYYSAVLFLSLHDHHISNAEFPIPLSVLENELEREDHNVALQPDRATTSEALKHFIIHLLRKCTKEPVNVTNYEGVLRNVLGGSGALPEGLVNPLTPSTSFHCLPTVCKIYIIGSLRQLGNLSNTNLKAITNDSESNVFYALPDGRVFVYAKAMTDQPINGTGLENQPWYSIYKHTQRFRFNLLSETESEWAYVEEILVRHNQHSAITALRSVLKGSTKPREDKVYIEERRVARARFLPFLTSLVAAEAPKPVQRKPVASTKALTTTLSTMSIEEENKKRCPYFPQCRRKCDAVHPKDDCPNLFNHRPCAGQSCLFLHGACPIDGQCDDDNCIHEHYESLPVVMRKKGLPKGMRVHERAKKNVRCQHFPRCRTSAEQCRFVHPTKKCKAFFDTVCVHGRLCVYLHGNCPNDGSCDDFECDHEHYVSLPVAQRRRESRRRDGKSIDRRRSRSRAVSVARSRRENTPDYDSRDQSFLPNSDSDDDEDDQNAKTVEQRCRFYPGCTNKHCSYIHPKDNCKAFPNCPYGGACLFQHKTCPKDGVCVKMSCNYEHIMRRNIGKTWCRNGSLCKKLSCTFIHPKECRSPCASPGSCWMYHPPAASAATSSNAASTAPPEKAGGRGRSAEPKRHSAPRNSNRKQKPERH